MQEGRRCEVHSERPGQLQPGDVLQRQGEWRREGCMDQGLVQTIGSVGGHAEELGG